MLKQALGVLSLSFALLLAVPRLLAATPNDDFDLYKLRIEGFWFYSNPSGSIQGAGDTAPVNFQADLFGQAGLEIHPEESSNLRG